MTPWSLFETKRKHKREHYCYCKTEKDEGWVECDNCSKWHHPSCVDTTMADIEEDRYTYDIWHCKFCCSNEVFVARNT